MQTNKHYSCSCIATFKPCSKTLDIVEVKISKVSTRLETQHVSNTIYFISFTLSNYYVLHAKDVGNWVLKGYKT
jgi:hypothetical protein